MNNKNINLENIKLIIWDMDETFWTGTLSEGEVLAKRENIRLVQELISKGVMNSICSKNDFKKVKEKLEEFENIWELFVFPSINWEPKGKRVKEIISNMQLREENVLFIDDNRMNLEEVIFYSPQILTLDANRINMLYEQIKKLPNEKRGIRLEQYKILEKKYKDKKQTTSNEEFLKESKIEISIVKECLSESERIYELLQRSNQLNYTKVRSTKEELTTLLENHDYDSAYIIARDKYGVYGIVGFYCMCKKTNEMVHFLFSCRVLGMGIEQYIYEKLNYPDLDIKGKVAINLEKRKKIEWIKLNEDFLTDELCQDSTKSKTKILFKGPCDLSSILGWIDYSGNVDCEFNYPNKDGIIITGFNHTELIVESKIRTKEEIEEVTNRIPFIDSGIFTTQIFKKTYDIIFLSLLPDAHEGLYVNRENGMKICFGSHKFSLTDSENWMEYINGRIEGHNFKFSNEILSRFSKEYNFVGHISKEGTIENLEFIKKNINSKTVLVLILGSELEYIGDEREFANHAEYHKELNDAVRMWVTENENVLILDPNDFIKSQEDFAGCTNHYSKRVYFEMAQKCIEIINQYTVINCKPFYTWKKYYKRIKNKFRKIMRKL